MLMKMLSGLLVVLLALLKSTSSQSLDSCFETGIFPKDLPSNGKYFIYSTQTIEKYSGKKHCLWFTTCPEHHNVKLVCPLVDIPVSPECRRDHLLIKTGKDIIPERKCGNKTIVSLSVARQMSVSLISPPETTGGRFWCQITCVRDKNCNL